MGQCSQNSLVCDINNERIQEGTQPVPSRGASSSRRCRGEAPVLVFVKQEELSGLRGRDAELGVGVGTCFHLGRLILNLSEMQKNPM